MGSKSKSKSKTRRKSKSKSNKEKDIRLNIKDLLIYDKNKKYDKRHEMGKKYTDRYKKTVDYLKHAPNEFHLKGYNYCGPYTRYHLRKEEPGLYEFKMNIANKKIVGTPPYNKPINKFDEACMHHDKAYNNAFTMKDVKKADVELLANLRKAKYHWDNKKTKLSLKQRLDYAILKRIIRNKIRINELNFSIINKRILNRDKLISKLKLLNQELNKEYKILNKLKKKGNYKLIKIQNDKINKLIIKIEQIDIYKKKTKSKLTKKIRKLIKTIKKNRKSKSKSKSK